jgi:hypothetical protein
VTPDPGAFPLLDEQAWAVIFDAAKQYIALSQLAADVADKARDGLEPLVAAIVAERVRLARVDERLRCAAACDRLGVPDVARVIRDSAA